MWTRRQRLRLVREGNQDEETLARLDRLIEDNRKAFLESTKDPGYGFKKAGGGAPPGAPKPAAKPAAKK